MYSTHSSVLLFLRRVVSVLFPTSLCLIHKYQPRSTEPLIYYLRGYHLSSEISHHISLYKKTCGKPRIKLPSGDGIWCFFLAVKYHRFTIHLLYIPWNQFESSFLLVKKQMIKHQIFGYSMFKTIKGNITKKLM